MSPEEEELCKKYTQLLNPDFDHIRPATTTRPQPNRVDHDTGLASDLNSEEPSLAASSDVPVLTDHMDLDPTEPEPTNGNQRSSTLGVSAPFDITSPQEPAEVDNDLFLQDVARKTLTPEEYVEENDRTWKLEQEFFKDITYGQMQMASSIHWSRSRYMDGQRARRMATAMQPAIPGVREGDGTLLPPLCLSCRRKELRVTELKPGQRDGLERKQVIAWDPDTDGRHQ
jgi:hypothetical protein